VVHAGNAWVRTRADNEVYARAGGGRESSSLAALTSLIDQAKRGEGQVVLISGEASYRTVETHVGAILSKLGFNSRAQIAVWAVEVGLVKHSELQ